MPEFVGTLTPPRHSAPPASPLVGQLYYDTDDNKLYYWNGTMWISGGGDPYYEQPAQPSPDPAPGAIWVDTDEPVAAGAVATAYDVDPIGTVKAFAGLVIPTNWMLADGRTLTRAGYSQLADALGVPAGNTTFAIPDLRNRFIYGGSAAGVGATGGTTSETLTAAQSGMPSHTPVANYMVNQQPSWTTGGNFPVPPGYGAGSSGGAKLAMTDAVPAQNASQSHNNMPPYITMAWIIKVTGATISAANMIVGATGAPGAPLPSYGTTLPTSPAHGDEHVLVDSLTNPSYTWRFKYNANSTSAYKWEFIGGAPIAVFVATNEGTATLNTWLDLATVGPRFLVPYAGEYFSGGTVNVYSNVAGVGAWFGISAGATNPTFQMPNTISTVNQGYISTIIGGKITVAAGSDVRLRYHNAGPANTMNWQYRYLSVQPVRIG